ncbi:protein-tyrosine-phosphatase [Tamilnaduibacter salinus]|uniref:Protein-tyrosine-phosphatase n=1 Tax=Tamilnaduibacter salinus TaxID=1484056 RepID=A0A2A2I516_9GAMM|nr:arsenate reductase ArsC [Tamilnaduibacter salinus]PAV26113.1 protein-tyrosine-phosphatase [Tamilnaduibacter salinus]
MSAVKSPNSKRPVILFLCTGNSCRSQMAEGLVHHYLGEQFDAVSAGTQPQSVNPEAIRTMAEIDYDLSGHRSQPLTDFQDRTIDYVVSVCDAASQLCPDFPGSHRLHWSIPDPANVTDSAQERRRVFRRTRRELESRIMDTFAREMTARQRTEDD